MPNICFLCASDEGIFLDISDDNRFFLKIESCLSLKASGNDALSTKICHKCAYELDKCNDFVHKYKERKLEKNLKQKKNCFFCQEPGKKGYFFNLKKTNQRSDAFDKIYYLFEELSNETDFFICLSCRYSIDLLFDLKSISEEVTEKLHKIIYEGIKVDHLSKTRTSIVRRKTTRIKNPKIGLQTSSDTESDSVTMARSSGKLSGNKANKKTKNRLCDECQTETEVGIDMFRIHRTGRTVCKNCWTTMDPEKNAGKNKRKRNNTTADTKSCKVFLKDVVRSATNREPKPFKVDKDEGGRLVFTVTDDSSSNESRSSTKTKAQLKELPEIKRATRMALTKTRKTTETINISDESDKESGNKQRTRGKNVKTVKEEKPKKEEKEKVQKEEKPKYETRKDKKIKFEEEKPLKVKKKAEKVIEVEKAAPKSRKRANGNQNLDSEVTQAKRKRSSSIESVTSNVSASGPKKSLRKTRNRGDSESTVASEASSHLDDLYKRKLRERSSSVVSVSSTASSKKGSKGKKNSISSKESTPVRDFKSPPSLSRPAVAKRGKGKPTKSQVDEQTSFVCAACKANFVQKQEYISHQEQHLKEIEIKLHRVHVEEKKETGRLNNIQEEPEQDDNQSKELERLKNKEPEDSCDKEQNEIESVEKPSEEKIECKETESVEEDKIESTKEDKTETVKEDKTESGKKDKSESIGTIESIQDKESVPDDKSESIQDKTEPLKAEEISEVTEDKSQSDSHSQDEEENLEDLLRNEEFQVIDEVAESASSTVDADEETGKEVSDEKSESVEEGSQDFTVAYTGSSQTSLTDVSPLNSEIIEEIKMSTKVETESLDKENNLEKDERKEEERKEIENLEEKKVSSQHSTPTRDEIENVKAIEEIQTESEIVEKLLEPIEEIEQISETNEVFSGSLSEINPIVPETDENLEQESLPQEIADVVQNGLDLIGNQEEITNEIIEEIERSGVENVPENIAQDTVSEVLQEVFDLATTKVYQSEEAEKTISFPIQENLEEISNDALNGGDMPSLETDESEISNL